LGGVGVFLLFVFFGCWGGCCWGGGGEKGGGGGGGGSDQRLLYDTHGTTVVVHS